MEQQKRVGEKDFFEEYGLEVKSGSVEVGETYPIFGMITKVVSDAPGNVVVELNFNILARMNIPDTTRIETLKERAFESGIFVSTVTSKEPAVEVECQTIIFGRRQGFNA
jgi:hypothetical protein